MDVITQSQPTHEKKRLEKKNGTKTQVYRNFSIIFPGSGWPWVVTFDGFNTIISMFSYLTPPRPNLVLLTRTPLRGRLSPKHPIDQSTRSPINPPTNHSVDHSFPSINQSIDQRNPSTNQPVDKSCRRSINASSDQPVDQSFHRLTNPPIDQPIGQPTRRPINGSTNRSIHQSALRPSNSQTYHRPCANTNRSHYTESVQQ